MKDAAAAAPPEHGNLGGKEPFFFCSHGKKNAFEHTRLPLTGLYVTHPPLAANTRMHTLPQRAQMQL